VEHQEQSALWRTAVSYLAQRREDIRSFELRKIVGGSPLLERRAVGSLQTEKMADCSQRIGKKVADNLQPETKAAVEVQLPAHHRSVCRGFPSACPSSFGGIVGGPALRLLSGLEQLPPTPPSPPPTRVSCGTFCR